MNGNSEPPFIRRTSISRKLAGAIIAILILLNIGVFGLFLSSRGTLEGLFRIHETRRLLDVTQQLTQTTEYIQDLSSTSDPLAFNRARKIYPSVAAEARAQLRAARAIAARDPNILALLMQVESAYRTFEDAVGRYLAAPNPGMAGLRRVLGRQFGLELTDALGRLRVTLNQRGDLTFDDVYRKRYHPLLVTILLLFVSETAFLFAGVRFARQFNHSIRVLNDATSRVSRGELAFQAPIARPDEFGALTDAFNKMTNALRVMNEEKAAEVEQRRILTEVSGILATSMDVRVTFHHIVQAAVPRLADCCVVQTQTQCGHAAPGTVELACGGPTRDTRLRDWAQKLDLATFARISDEELRTFGIHSYLLNRLQFHDHVFGILLFLHFDPPRPGHSRLIEEFSNRASMALENARLYQEAQSAILSRDEFLSIASHELKTPLTSLSLQLQILNIELKKSIAAAQATDTISVPKRTAFLVAGCEEQTMKLAQLLDELLDLTRIRLGQLRLAPQRVDLSAIVTRVLERFRIEAAQHGVTLSLQSNPHASGLWDPIRVEQIVTNLISNAIKYGNRRPVAVIVETDDARRSVQLIVRDHGIGIKPEMQGKIFRRFERGSVSGTKIAGLGLGLYICRQIVEAHGGSISVESEVGEGSTFKVELPYEIPSAALAEKNIA